ncbi:alkaline phosphatase D [Cryptococcus gattii Ru294]|nr:alkaline phosphatase D [Cryptococcus gattii Ru294]
MTKFAGEKLPTGSRYLPIILSCTLVYLASYFTLRSLAQKPTRASLVTPILALGGLYHPAYWRLSTAGALITLVAPLLSYDFVYRAHFLHPSQHISFARVGWVTETSARLLLRSTVPDQVDVSYWPSHDSSAVSHVELSQSSLKTDFTSRLYIEDLQPGITYFYNSTAGHKGSFTTRRSKHDQKQFNLLSTSCQKPNWPYNPLSHSLAISGLEHVDKIYSSPSWTPLLRSIPWLHMFDDHEIINDYAPSSSALSDLFIQAIDPFINYQQAVNPPPISLTQPTYFRFEIGDVSFFVLDCRSWRSTQPARPGANSTAGFGNRTMLGESQLTAVKEWAEEGTRDGKLLVLVSGVPITRNWSEGKDEMDSWAG